MKFIALVLFSVFVYCSADAPPGGMHEMFGKKIDEALKRKHGDSYAGTADDSCAKACITAPPQGFGKYLVKFKEPKLEDLKEIYDKEMLTKVCGYSNKTAACIRACPETQRRTFMRNVFAPIKYMCEDTKFVEYAPCYKETIEIMQPVCLADDKCGPKKTALVTNIQAYKAANPKTKPVIETAVDSFCQLADCGIDCSEAKRIEKCGADANTVLKGFYKELVKSAKEARYFSPRDFVIDIPASCDQVGN
jgi:hypothetical protein